MPHGTDARPLRGPCRIFAAGCDPGLTSHRAQISQFWFPTGTSSTAQAMPGTADGREPNPDGSAAEWWHQRLAVLAMIPEHFPRYMRVSLQDHWDGVRRSDVEAERTQLPAACGVPELAQSI
jgi:hypothetical protein